MRMSPIPFYPVQSCASLLIPQLPRVCLALQLVYHFAYGLRDQPERDVGNAAVREHAVRLKTRRLAWARSDTHIYRDALELRRRAHWRAR